MKTLFAILVGLFILTSCPKKTPRPDTASPIEDVTQPLEDAAVEDVGVVMDAMLIVSDGRLPD